MDRHDIPHGITAKHVAEMHQEDLKVQHLYGCKGMTYWCDDSRMTAFCLIEAPNRKALQDMHNHAHGDVPHSIIEVDGKIVESFLGRIEDPESIKSKELEVIDETAFRFIMVTSLENLYFKNDDNLKKNLELLDLKESIAGIIDDFDGRVVHSKSDCFLGSFTSVSKAVSCALEVQTKFKEFIDLNTIENFNLQIGLSAGVPVTKKESLFEDAIKLAERLCNIVKGKIVLSSEIKELYKSENSNVFVDSIFIKTLHPSDEKFLNILMNYTEKIWNNTDMNVDKFSKDLGYSKSQLYRKMIAITGKSPNTFLKEYRLNKALNLLNRQVGNISEVAFETGFNSPAYFSKCFSEVYGVLPSRYAKQVLRT